MPGFNHLGAQVFRFEFDWDGVGSVFNKRVGAEKFAELSASWASQFDSAMGYLVCLKKGTCWVVVAQY